MRPTQSTAEAALALAAHLIEKEGWRWNAAQYEDDPRVTQYLLPPENDPRLHWCAIWSTIPGTNKVMPHWAFHTTTTNDHPPKNS